MQIAEITNSGDPELILRLNAAKDCLEELQKSRVMYERIQLYTGMTDEEIENDMKEKVRILKWMVKKGLYDVNKIGMVIAKYYLGSLKMD